MDSLTRTRAAGAAMALSLCSPVWADSQEAAAQAAQPASAPASAPTSAPASAPAAPAAQQVTISGSRTKVATRTDTELTDIPQSVSVVPITLALDRGATTLQEALRYSPSVTAEPWGPDTRTDDFLVRGMEAMQTQDGIRRIFSLSPLPKPDLSTLERIEVLRGPSGVLYGQGPSGGVVNAVTKVPQWKERTEVALGYASYQQASASLDWQTAAEDAPLAVRLVLAGHRGGTFMPQVDSNRWLVAPSLAWQPFDGAQLALSALVQRDGGGSTLSYLPLMAAMPTDGRPAISPHTYLGNPDFDRIDERLRQLTAQWQQELAPGWEWSLKLRDMQGQSLSQMTYADSYTDPLNPYIDPNRRIVARMYWGERADVRVQSLDTALTGRVQALGLAHQIVAGVDQHHYRDSGAIASGESSPIDLDAPVLTAAVHPSYEATPRQRAVQRGLYLQDQLTAGPWVAVVGMRRDWSRAETEGEGVQSTAQTSWRAGAVYKGWAGFFPYASYSQSFQPVLGVDAYGKPFKPLQGRQWEGGLKWEPSRDVSMSLAAYRTIEVNRQNNDPDNPYNVIQTGKLRSQGLELEGSWAWAGGWSLQGALARSQTITLTSTLPYEVGQPVVGVPSLLASAWLAQRTAMADLPLDWAVGVRHIGASLAVAPDWRVTTPAVTLLDARVGLRWLGVDWSLSGSNLTGKNYLVACRTIGDCFSGAAREVKLEARWVR